MSATRTLTKNGVTYLQQNKKQPVNLQIIYFTRKSINNNQTKIRIVLSDGKKYIHAMLANETVSVKKYSIIKITNYICLTVCSRR